MAAFKIHEDNGSNLIIRNPNILDLNKKYSNGHGKNVMENKFNKRRTVLGQLTDSNTIINNTVNWNKDSSVKNVPGRKSNITCLSAITKKEDNASAVPKKRNDQNLLQKTCFLVPQPHTLSAEHFESPRFDNDLIQNMSIEYSADTSIISQIDNPYQKDVLEYLLKAEQNHRPHPFYMKKQKDLTDSMRAILVDWLVAISDEYTLVSDTLYLAVSYIDRLLSKMSVIPTKLQLVGVAGMMIAAKYEEIYPPDIAEFSYLTNSTYTTKQIRCMEKLMLRVLSFDMTTPTVQTFIDEFTLQADISNVVMNLAMFISELCLVESVQFIQYLPSELAAASLALSRYMLHESDLWPQKIHDISGYSLEKLMPIIKKQYKVLEESPNKSLQAVRLKFDKDCYKGIIDLKFRKWPECEHEAEMNS